jgi:hypothetical protein
VRVRWWVSERGWRRMDAFGVSDAFHHDDIWVWAYISHCDPLQQVERWGDREKEHCPCVCVFGGSVRAKVRARVSN